MLFSMRDQHPAILPWFSNFGWRPSLRLITGTVPVTSSRRIAAGRCRFEHGPFGKTGFRCFRIMPRCRIVCLKNREKRFGKTIMQKARA
jgi:hypothetical protein